MTPPSPGEGEARANRQRRLRLQQERAENERALARAEMPIIRDLASVGIEVDTVWDLVNTSTPYPEALPILLQHLQDGAYPDRVRAGLARALAVRPSWRWWAELRALYAAPRGFDEEESLVVALAAAARKDHLDDLIAMATDETRDAVRVLFLDAIRRVGGPGSLVLLEAWQDDDALGPESRRLLARESAAARRRASGARRRAAQGEASGEL